MSLVVTAVEPRATVWKELNFRPHDKYWFDDGSLLLRVQNVLYKVHRTLLYRHSTVLSSSPSPTDGLANGVVKEIDGLQIVHSPKAVSNADVEVLLDHLYHDVPFDNAASFWRVASLLRVSSQEQLGFAAIHTLAKTRLEQLFLLSPHAFSRPKYTEDALALAVKYDIPSIRKPLYYSVATYPHECNLQKSGEVTTTLTPDIVARCDALLEQLVAHFTPILFTVATAGHMVCTDVFAEKWMLLVIQPALNDNGLCRPLETLERIIGIDWAAEGLCAECVNDKRKEWRDEQRDVWERMDEWLR